MKEISSYNKKKYKIIRIIIQALIILLLETAYNIFRTIENYYEYEHLFLAAINLILLSLY